MPLITRIRKRRKEDSKMNTKRLKIVLVALFFLVLIPQAVRATRIDACTPDKSTYQQGGTGYLTVTVFNDEAEKIRVTQLAATIDHFHSDGTVYKQTFNTNATLPVEIQVWQSTTFHIPFSLPADVAPGYMRPSVRANAEIWNDQYQMWMTSGSTVYQAAVYVESPYKQQFEQQQLVKEQLQEQLDALQEHLDAQQATNLQQTSQISLQQNSINQLSRQVNDLQTTNNTNTMTVYALVATTMAFAGVAALLFMMTRKARPAH
jgi:polyhydroxyalkanoate synthesis regulator phasin